MQIENIKAQAREEIARIFPDADVATRERMVAVYIAGAAYIVEEDHSRPCGSIDYWLLTNEVRHLTHARVANAG